MVETTSGGKKLVVDTTSGGKNSGGKNSGGNWKAYIPARYAWPVTSETSDHFEKKVCLKWTLPSRS